MTALHDLPEASLGERADLVRVEASRRLATPQRAELGQFMTPAPVAAFMANLLRAEGDAVRLLDAGAGVGSLTAAAVDALLSRPRAPSSIRLETWEIDATLRPHLVDTLHACTLRGRARDVAISTALHPEDFITAALAMLDGGLFRQTPQRFTTAILNPPYRKLRNDDPAHTRLQRVGIDAPNLYAAFVALAIELLEPGGELIAITPRSFCNGPYFRAFRERFLSTMQLQRVHLFDTRNTAFRDDAVLQETVIVHALKGPRRPGATVVVSSSQGPDDPCPVQREVPLAEVVRDDDPDRVIHLVADALGAATQARVTSITTGLRELDVQVSTGRVVDFRVREHLRDDPSPGTVPLLYPQHLVAGEVRWPKTGSRKANAIADVPATAPLLLPAGAYVLTKRFSAKEERRRIVATLYDPDVVKAPRVGIENHLNVLHRAGAGLPLALARGLVAWLNSTLVDQHFRSWSGHTQVNATDLRAMPFPSATQLESLGAAVPIGASQHVVDDAVERYVFSMTTPSSGLDPVMAKRRMEEALALLDDLGLPREQRNERSALALLALADLRPASPWHEAQSPLLGITPMMEFFKAHYGKEYAPNTRETVRRFTVHQFVEAGLLRANPDDPKRPTNSPKAVYQLDAALLDLLRAHGTPGYAPALATWKRTHGALRAQYAQERAMHRVPVVLAPGQTLQLSPGPHNELVRQVIEEFCPRFTPGGRVLYVGDTENKWALFDATALAALGVTVDEHGKMPDLVLHDVVHDWLVLIEVVTSHGPVNAKRRGELAALFAPSTAGLVFVTAFLDRAAMKRWLPDISWETEVWVADAPTHMIHFNGERFLGPY